MRHRRTGRVLGRAPSHRKALIRNMVSAIFLTERPESEFDPNQPKVKGRIITTLAKAKEIRPIVERCITIAKKGLAAEQVAEQFGTQAERNTAAWKEWRESDRYAQWVAARAPAVNARRRVFDMLRDPKAVSVLFSEIAGRFADRPGGYTRILRLAKPRLGDAGPRAILEFVGKHDRVVRRSEKPAFGGDEQAAATDNPSSVDGNTKAS